MIKERLADGLLIVSSFFNWLATKAKNGAIRVLLTRPRRKPSDRSDGGLDIVTRHEEINS